MTSQDQEYRMIPLTQGQWAIVDISDYERLNQWKWCARWSSDIQGFYAMRNARTPDGRKITILMHREILGLQKGDRRIADHALHNTLDQRRFVSDAVNLRIVTPSQSVQNTGKQANNTSGYKGVYWCKQKNKWRARISVNGKIIHLGFFATPELGYEAYCVAASKYHGEFAWVV